MKLEGHLEELPAGYSAVLAELKEQFKSARIKAGLAVNRELVLQYWGIGRQILRQQRGGRGGAPRLSIGCLWTVGVSFRR